MSRAPLSAADRRALTLGAAVVIPALLFVFVVKPYRASLAAVREQLAVEQSALARERAAVDAAVRHPQLQHVADSAMRAMTPRLFGGRDDVMASAEVATWLGDVARASHVWLQNASTRPATAAEGGVRVLHVDVRGESDLRGVLTFLTALEHGDKFVRVQRLELSVQPGRSDQPGVETLAIAASIIGYAIPEQTPAAATVARTVARSGAPGAP